MPELAHVGVLVTRPKQQAKTLAQHIEAAGGRAVLFPTLEILGPDHIAPLNKIIDRLHEFALAIFISPNAVNYTIEAIHARRGQIPQTLQLACVGQGTAKALMARGYKSSITPEEKFNSEALLALPALHHVKNQNIVIFRGNGGRDVLRKTLTQRGAKVVYGECYRRRKPEADTAPLLEHLKKGHIHIITATSGDGLRNLADMVGEACSLLLKQLPLVVISPRVAAIGQELGFHKDLLVAANATDEAIVNTIKLWRRKQKNL